ncbi:MAG: hypothetical protein JXR83_13095 [Deltaproteobacteria bacterium]|nr:hypothetical protein [Deltaproteobacteria bacterium]
MRRASGVVVLGLLLVAGSALAEKDEVQKIAEAYLNALSGKGGESAREYLLGGVTLSAELVTVPNWKIVKRERVKVEEANLADAVKEMKAYDAKGRKMIQELLKLAGDNEIREITKEQAEKIMKPTEAERRRFMEKFPLFAIVARIDRDVYWHPKNPWRVLLDKLGTKGDYRLEFHRFEIEEIDHGKKRVWPLRILRMQTQKFDTGYKILPASDWDPES